MNNNSRQNFIVDKEIDLNEYDFLKTKIYSDSLTQVINSANEKKVFTIGLFGNWGTGKSSIVKTSEKDFNEKKVKFITYDAWQYCNDSFRRMFLRKLKDDLKYEETDLMKNFYENESIDTGESYKFNWKHFPLAIVILSTLFLGFIFIIQFLDTSLWKQGISFLAIINLISLLFALFQGFTQKLKISITKPHIFAPEQFEDCFIEIISNSLIKTNFIEKINRWIKGNNAIKDLEKLIIVIDNIDRCSNDIAYNLLTDIKTFLCTGEYNIIFIIPVDDEALCNHILNRNNEININCYKEEFLRKFFNVVIRIKPYGETDMYSFARNISKKAGMDFKNETINLAAKEYSKNPRRVIQLFNNLVVEFSLYKNENFVKNNETLICAVLILREEFNDLYKKIINHPQLFIDWKPNDKNLEFNRFIRIVYNSIGTIELSALNEILTNSYNIFSTEIRNSVDTFDIKTILELFPNNRNTIIDYIIDRIIFAINNSLIDNELTGLFDLIYKINVQHNLEKHENLRVIEKLESFYIEGIIINSKAINELCIYALTLNEQGIDLYYNYILNILKRDKEHRISNWKSLFNASLKVFNDKSSSEKLSDIFSVEYNEVEDIEFSSEQWNYLFTNTFIQNLINISTDIKKESDDYESLIYIFSNKKNITKDTYIIFINKAKDIIGDLRGKSKEDISIYIKSLNPLLELIPNGKLSDELKVIYDLVTKNRRKPHQSYPTQKQYDSEINFIDECLKENTFISDIITFAINIYRITNNNTSTNDLISKLLINNRKELNEKLLILVNNNFTLIPIVSLLLQDKDYNNENTITLLKHCFNIKDKEGKSGLSETDMISKLEELLNYAYDEKSNKIYDFLESIYNDKDIKDILSSIIIKKDSNFINNLPKAFLNLAVQSFTDENYSEFCNNFHLLSIIALHGSISQGELLIKLLIPKIDNNENIENVLQIINLIENIKDIDPDGLLITHLKKYKRENKDNISEELEKQFEQILKKLKIDIKLDENL